MQITIRPQIPSPTTELHIGPNLLQQDLLQTLCQKAGTKIAIIADAFIAQLYGIDLAKRLNAKLFTIPSGEEAKTRKTCEKIEDELLQAGFGKTSVLIALGGGATTDAVGFIASIYLRGVSLILIPTTLLAMVDAAIGGKTAIDTPFGKNLLGTTYHPKAVLIDLQLLEKLPEKEWKNGLAEVWKLALIYDKKIWKQREEKEIFIEAIKAKVAIIEQDPMDKGVRRILNFGHTIGHALEKIADYKISHGEGVAIGSAAAAHLSMRLGYLSSKEFDEIQAAYSFFSLRLPKNYTQERLFEAMAHDKKAIDQGVRFVLIDRIGHAMEFEGQYCRSISKQELLPTLEWMEIWLCK